MSRPHPVLPAAAAAARAQLPEADTAAFDRLAAAVLTPSGAPLAGALRAQLPGTTGVRWLRQEGLSPTARAGELDEARWLSLWRCWSASGRSPAGAGRAGRGVNGRPSTHGHAPGASAIPRYY